MEVPCKDCITFSICKNKYITDYIDDFRLNNSILQCPLVREYFNFPETKTILEFMKVIESMSEEKS